ncbi:Bacteriophage P22, Gp10, DNA-stabilising [uncultured Caudovirales phage]|uniref:Bacteriophage P22, Gp10, DNA-stabilising n=1 Tax=uncultured Caudovirales phage TaxID=2100421 RepID=A0A6J7WC93_9CAUD|nr:Bacteriophage P22, Gp10, DNA-stabilising [uncultured Caudovirales phage]
MKTPILGSSYVARSINAADNRMINLFPEVIPEGGKEPGFLNRAPGLQLQQTVGTGPIRALWAHQTNGADFYVVSGTEVYKMTSLTATPVKIGDVADGGPVSIADNGTQLFFACNGPSYIYNEATNEFKQITDPDFPGAVTVGYLDGYFVFNEPNSQRVWVTALLDGSSIDPLDFASAEGSPDGLVAVNVDHREAWLFGTDSVEVWYDVGGTDFPLQRIQGAFNEIGCVAAFSIAKLDNSLFWLGTDARGQGIVYKANGYTGQRVSTHAIEYAIAQYGNISDAVAYTYQQEGHGFYVLTFPSANATWVYDAATQAWHERAGLVNGQFTRHRSNCQCNFGGNTVVGDFENGNIYTFDLDVYADNGAPQKWLRSWRALPTGQNNLNRSAHHSLQLDAETGVGLNSLTTDQNVFLITQNYERIITESGNRIVAGVEQVPTPAPQVMLRWSDDGGHTWSNEHWTSMGRIGEYGHRTIWRRLGMTLKLRDRVYEVSGTDPVKVAIVGAELHASPTNA